ncbi:uncharacterized protein VTP21DRAFT_4260 [Calcarisporiella thermophila]|uniref:uncharacterized protein n=1 Tax=Calcarisporiella thermophila TaxID=911321 RepID=UPI0037443117
MPELQDRLRNRKRYIELSDEIPDRPDPGFTDAQFEIPEQPIPWKSIYLAVFLFMIGSLGVTLGALIYVGIIAQSAQDSGLPLLILGSLCFIPGSYYTYIAYYAYKGYEGYDFSQIPDWDD